MRKVAMYLAGGAVAAAAALVAAPPAEALPGDGFSIKAVSGTFTVTPPGDISDTTSSVTEASLAVLAVSGALVGVVQPNDSVILDPSTLPFPLAAGFVPISPFTLTVHGLQFTFDTAKTDFRQATVDSIQTGFLDGTFLGTLTDGNGIFNDGTAVRLAENCNQVSSGVPISCSLTFGVTGSLTTVVSAPEPASLTILGASLLGFGLLRRRRTL